MRRLVAVLLCGVALALAWFSLSWGVRGSESPTHARSANEREHSFDHAANSDEPARREQPLVIPAPQRMEVAAPTASARILTLEGAILRVLDDSHMGTDRDVPASPKDILKVLADPKMNPERKILSAEAERELSTIIARQNEEERILVQRRGAITRRALEAAVAEGRFVTMEGVTASTTISLGEARRETERRAGVMRSHFEGMGEFLVDWAGSQFATTEPDGIPRSTFVYFTRQQAPDVFEVRSQVTDVRSRHTEECAEFIRRQVPR